MWYFILKEIEHPKRVHLQPEIKTLLKDREGLLTIVIATAFFNMLHHARPLTLPHTPSFDQWMSSRVRPNARRALVEAKSPLPDAVRLGTELARYDRFARDDEIPRYFPL